MYVLYVSFASNEVANKNGKKKKIQFVNPPQLFSLHIHVTQGEGVDAFANAVSLNQMWVCW